MAEWIDFVGTVVVVAAVVVFLLLVGWSLTRE